MKKFFFIIFFASSASVILAQDSTKLVFTRIAQNVVESLKAKDYEGMRRDFSDTTRAGLSVDLIKNVSENMASLHGDAVALGSLGSLSQSQATFRVRFERDSMNLNLTLDKHRKITTISFTDPDPVIPTIVAADLSQENLKSYVDKIVTPYLSSPKNVGMTVGIIYKRKHYVFGYGRMAKGSAAVPDGTTLFEIGSATKVFTSVLLAEMVQNGTVRLNDPVKKFLPDSVTMPLFTTKEITLEHLATHTSGLPQLPDNLSATMKDLTNPYANYSVEDLYSFLAHCKLTREAGSEYEYSNLGAGLLGHVLARARGKSYEELVTQHISKPLGMNDTKILLSRAERLRFAQGYANGNAVSGWDFPTLAGAGALRSTADDMVKFLSANISHGESPLEAVLESCQATHFKTKHTALEIGLGWHISVLNSSPYRTVWHNGGTGGFRSYMGFVKETNTGVVVLSNSSSSVDDVGVALLKLLN